MQTAITIEVCVGGKGFHHGLIIGFGVVSTLQNNVAFCHDAFHVAVNLICAGNHIPLGISADFAGREPVIFRMDQNGIVFRSTEVKNCLQNLICNFDQLHGL